MFSEIRVIFAEKTRALFLDASAFFAISINFILIILILTKSPKTLGAYKYLMVYIAFFELAYAGLYVAEKPTFFTKDSAFLLITNTKNSIFPRRISMFVEELFIGFYGLAMAILAIHFIYRYLALSSNIWLHTFESWKLVLWLMFPIANAGIWWFVAAVIFAGKEDSDRYLKKFYLPLAQHLVNFEDIYCIGPFYYLKDVNGKSYINWISFQGTAISLSLICLSFTTMIYFGSKGYKSMSELMSLSTVSDHVKNIHSQLFKTLIFQTMIPVLLMHIPATVTYITSFFNVSSEIFGEILDLSIALYPVLNPLPTIFIVTSYRKAVIGKILKKIKIK
nr:hypothetical protein F41B5.8 - Caenorhabditis elegans [Caenorhabditis elegans]